MTNVNEHTTKAFDIDLQELVGMIGEMGARAERQFADAVDALTKGDSQLGASVIEADATLDARQRLIEHKAIATIARRQPCAVDLREIVGVLRIANDLERIGDLAKNIGKRAILLRGETLPEGALARLIQVSRLALSQFHDVLDSLADRDCKKALDVWNRDKEVDSLYTLQFGELLTHMMDDPGVVTLGIHLLFCAKNIERMGDHVTNVAEALYYMVKGEALAQERPKADATSVITIAPHTTYPFHVLVPAV